MPRLSPDIELATIRALMKPQLRNRVEHRLESAEQLWPAEAEERMSRLLEIAARELGFEADVHFPAAGEYRLIAQVRQENLAAAMATAVLLSKSFAGTWFVIGRLYVRDGAFYRRERGVKLNLVPATNVHLSREQRASLRKAMSVVARASRP